MIRPLAAALLVLALLLPGVAEARAYRILRTGIYAMRTDLLVAILAKELCTCRHVNGVGVTQPVEVSVGLCLERAQLPITPGLVRFLTGIEVRDEEQEFEVDRQFLLRLATLFSGRRALARYDAVQPRYGCTLIRQPPPETRRR